MASESAWRRVAAFVPKLDGAAHKGQHGKIAVLGGSSAYTGAPYYAAMSSLRAGGDLAHVLCEESASLPIKTYSPELIVHSIWRDDEADLSAVVSDPLEGLSGRIDALVVGPGLGRSPRAQAVCAASIRAAKSSRIPLVLDADALFFVASDPSLVANHTHSPILLTPNPVELGRLCRALSVPTAPELVAKLGGPHILQKGPVDRIFSPLKGDGPLLLGETPGMPRRCGGQGDILSGISALFLSWAVDSAKDDPEHVALAAYAASCVTRTAAALAFAEHKRATVCPDLIQQIGPAMDRLFPIE